MRTGLRKESCSPSSLPFSSPPWFRPALLTGPVRMPRPAKRGSSRKRRKPAWSFGPVRSARSWTAIRGCRRLNERCSKPLSTRRGPTSSPRARTPFRRRRSPPPWRRSRTLFPAPSTARSSPASRGSELGSGERTSCLPMERSCAIAAAMQVVPQTMSAGRSTMDAMPSRGPRTGGVVYPRRPLIRTLIPAPIPILRLPASSERFPAPLGIVSPRLAGVEGSA